MKLCEICWEEIPEEDANRCSECENQPQLAHGVICKCETARICPMHGTHPRRDELSIMRRKRHECLVASGFARVLKVPESVHYE